MTVSSAPTTTSSSSSGAPASLELEKGIFAAPRLALEPKDRSAWDKLQPRLQDTINNTLKIQQGLESTISCEFMMGGPGPNQLKPTVFLVCCHEAYRKQLRAILKRQKWMREYGYQCVVIVDAIWKPSLGSLDDIPDLLSIPVQAYLPNNKSTLCGLQAQARSRPNDAPVKFTIGGVLLIDNKACGLTVGHVAEKLIPPQDGNNDDGDIDDVDGDDDDDDDDDNDESAMGHGSSSPFIKFEDADSVGMTGLSSPKEDLSVAQPQDEASRDESTPLPNSESGQIQSEHDWHQFGYFDASTTARSTVSCSRLDWSLVSLDPGLETVHRPLINTLEMPTGDRIFINNFLEKSAIKGCEVWIYAGSKGLVRGWLLDSAALLHQDGKTFPVLQVISDKPLGTWSS
ncbi:hypothetical protein Daus18300_000503 [Diaporthe australafricana]|uniref:Uncharacterized protein n=1 Tax=Diaporthe australafricana TaxID=127596 RepID=A0ABR3Y3J0_9PEZI